VTAIPPVLPQLQQGLMNRGPVAAKTTYRSFAIVSPENEGSVIANTGIFEVRVSVDPSLQLGEGHALW